jgi:hypothetical protein
MHQCVCGVIKYRVVANRLLLSAIKPAGNASDATTSARLKALKGASSTTDARIVARELLSAEGGAAYSPIRPVERMNVAVEINAVGILNSHGS